MNLVFHISEDGSEIENDFSCTKDLQFKDLRLSLTIDLAGCQQQMESRLEIRCLPTQYRMHQKNANY